MAGPNTLEFTDQNFEIEVLSAEGPVLVDFWAPWCGPCKALGPTIDELATEFKGKIKIGKVDTDANQDTAARFGVTSLPTIMLFHNGEVIDRSIGLKSKASYEHMLNSALTAS